MSNGNGNGVKVPSWAVGTLVTLFLSFLGFWGVWSQARADVETLKDRVSSLETLPSAVSSMQADIDTLKNQSTEMRQDIKTLLARRS